MKKIVLLLTVLGSLSSFAASVVASNTAKAFEGKNGEKVEMVEVNNGKEVLVRMSGVGGEWEGKTILWNMEDMGDKKNIYFEKKRGSKTEQVNTLTFRFGQWQIYTEKNPNGIDLKYSKKESEKLKTEELVSSYK
jgi:hypothetical protein